MNNVVNGSAGQPGLTQKGLPLSISYLASMQFALILLIILGIFFLIGAVFSISIQESYILAFLVLLLFISLLWCTIRRLKSTWRLFTGGTPGASIDTIISKPLQAEVLLKESTDLTLEKVKQTLKNKGFRVIQRSDVLLYADCKRIGFTGSLVMHLGLLLMIVGMAYGALAGFKGTVYLAEGQFFTEEHSSYGILTEGWRNIFLGSHRSFQANLENFDVSYSSDYVPNDYVSWLIIFDNGQEVMTKDIRVNAPLSYQGIKIYQQTYGWAPQVKIEETDGYVILEDTLFCAIGENGIGTTSFSTPYANVEMNFIVVPNQATEGSMTTLSPLPDNPVLFFILSSGSTIMTKQEIPLGSSVEFSGLIVSFKELRQYSGLQVASSPELPIIYAGFCFFTFGLLMVFFWRPQWIWIIIETQDGGTRINFRGDAGRRGYSFQDSFNKVVAAIRNSI